jgi:CHAT domain-containing protein
VLETVRNGDLSEEQVESRLHSIVDVLDEAGPGGLQDPDLVARFSAMLALRVLGGEELGPDAEEALRAIPGAERRSWTVWELADAHFASGRFEDAGAIARFGLEREPAATMEPRLWHVRAEAARLLGRWDEVDAFLDRMEGSIPPHATYEGDPARRAYLAQNHAYRSRLLQGRAQALLALGLLDRCRELVFEAIAEAEASADRSALAAARLLAFDRALASGNAIDEALEIARAGLAEERLETWHSLLRVAEGVAALEKTRDALSRSEDGERPAAEARTALTAALAARPPRAEQLKAELGLGELGHITGRVADARAHLGRARELVQDFPGGGPANESIRLAMLAWDLARGDGAAPGELERSRAELLVAYRAFLEQWETTPRRPGGIGFLHISWRSQVVSEAIEAELSASPDAAGAARAFERLLEAQAMGTLARERGLAGIGIADVRAELLAERRGMLVLLPARDCAHLFVLDAKSLEHERIPVGRDALRRIAREITAALQRPDGEVDRNDLHRLHDTLLSATARARIATWSGAITVGFDLLCDLPFGILGGESGSPYAQRLALGSLPSVALGVDLARRRKDLPASPASGSEELVLVVAADPPEGLGLRDFRFGEDERERLSAPFAKSFVLLEEREATRSRLLARRAELGRAAVVHFLAHGTALPGLECPSALVLSRAAPEAERFFTAEDAAQLELGGLVILSACGSGRGPARVGDDRLVHLGGAFLDAGARCVVVARFPVEYEATLALMQHFHERLAKGDAPAEALRAARVACAGQLAAYHAAAFEVLGLGFEPVLER